MGDSLEEKVETKERLLSQENETAKAEKTPEKKLATPVISDEKFEKLHLEEDSKYKIESKKSEKTNENEVKSEEIKIKTEDNKVEETKVKPEEKNVKAEEINEDKKDGFQEKPVKVEKIETITEKSKGKSIVSDSILCSAKDSKEKIARNQSDIFSLKDVSTTLQTSIFSVNGCPSRRVFRKQEPAGHVFQRNDDPPADKMATPIGNRITKENYNDEKRPSSSYRNPLTGSGLSSNDEYKSKGIKRKDGNPLLGLGYDSEVTSVTSQHRIPPGGYSHKLW